MIKQNYADQSPISERIDLLLASEPFIILDGAMGTELQRHGYHTALPLWSAMANVEAPVVVKKIHDANIMAGADIITANTFRTTGYTFAKAGMADMGFYVTRLAVEIAGEAIAQSDRQLLLAGSLAPLEDCYSPELVPHEELIRSAYREQIGFLIEAGVDLILCETMINRSEALIAAEICRTKAFPFMMSFTAQGGGLLDGTLLEAVIPEICKTGPLALLLNCRTPAEISGNLSQLRLLSPGLIGAYGNGPGHPDPVTGWCGAKDGVHTYAEAAWEWYEAGARMIGGCCGTTPGHIQALAELRAEILSEH